VDRDTLHAVMRVCLRLTRNFENAMIFGGLGGVRLLLNLTLDSSFTGFLSLSTLLIRHVMEEPHTLRHAMEKVLELAVHYYIIGLFLVWLYLVEHLFEVFVTHQEMICSCKLHPLLLSVVNCSIS